MRFGSRLPPETARKLLFQARRRCGEGPRGLEGTFLWYSANTEVLQELLGFLYAESCTRNKAIEPRNIVSMCK
jgi:hypothetical protein